MMKAEISLSFLNDNFLLELEREIESRKHIYIVYINHNIKRYEFIPIIRNPFVSVECECYFYEHHRILETDSQSSNHELSVLLRYSLTHIGYEEINWYYPAGKSGMFYNMFTAYGHNPIDPDSRIPLILWLQGGPGASSQFGAFTENGPIKITQDKISQISYPWNIIGHTVFIDQPLNVGFSYSNEQPRRLVNSARQAAEHLLNFLDNFYKQWPALKQSPLYITGESFAGHYIPAFAQRIVNNKTFLNNTKIILEGVAIGDGWTDPYNQVNQYDSYLYSVGVVSNKFRDTCTWFQTQAIQNMALGDVRNVQIDLLRQPNTLISLPTMMIPDTNIGVE